MDEWTKKAFDQEWRQNGLILRMTGEHLEILSGRKVHAQASRAVI
jgi:hypothetical protein